MSEKYRLPTKIKRFGIQDPFLQLIVSKYENEIPWGSGINDEQTLSHYVEETMLRRLLARTTFPPQSGSKHFFISPRHVDLDAALDTDIELDQTEIGVVRLIREEDGVDEAIKALIEVVNARKAAAFRQWTDMVGGQFLRNAAFALLLLRPLFNMAGKGARRSVLPPSTDVVDWLYRRISSGRLSPNDNVARVYCWKLASGSRRIPENGWQYISADPWNAAELSAACRGSGWCVASGQWAADYLGRSAFYILRSSGKPVVALRSDPEGQCIIECQGRHNGHPNGWCADIDFFVRSQGIDLLDRTDAVRFDVSRLGDLADQPEVWWRERVRYWPFSAQFAPKKKVGVLAKESATEIRAYLEFPSFASLADRAGVVMDPAEWSSVIEIDPRRFSQCPAEFQEDPQIRAACVRGWIDWIRDDELTLLELMSLEAFVREDAAFSEALELHFPEALSEMIRRPPRNAGERLDRFRLESVLPASTTESKRLAVERAVNQLLTNETSDFSDAIFPEALRARVDFSEIREKAWVEAMAVHSPLYFALPEDLIGRPEFKLRDGVVARVDVNRWVEKVRQKPWLLTQQKGVPKTIRCHRQILDAYRNGWVPYLEAFPWRIWVKRGLHRRVYMSYALLVNARIVDAFTEGWRRRKKKAHDSWSRASRRMQDMPVLQVAALRAFGHRREVHENVQVLRACQAIAQRNLVDTVGSSTNPLKREVYRRLIETGLVGG